VTGQHADLTLGRTGDDHLGLSGPHLLFDGDDFDMQLVGHPVSFESAVLNRLGQF